MANTGRASTSKSNQASKTRTNSYNKSRSKKQESKNREIKLWITLAVCVFFLLSSFRICGPVGNFFANILFGLFGTVAYFIPIYVFFTSAFFLSNGVKKELLKRAICVGLFVIVVAFICQMVHGVDSQTVKSLYLDGSNDKKGGGVILGGVLLLIHELIGFTGSVIVTILLSIIGIIIVLDVSIIGSFKNNINYIKNLDDGDDEDYPYEDLETVRERNRDSSRNVLNKIKVIDESTDKKTKNRKQSKVQPEEVHELKPVAQDKLNLAVYKAEDVNVDFFDKDIFNNAKQIDIADSFDDENALDNPEELKPVKRKRKKTKASQASMEAERDAIAASISGITASPDSTFTLGEADEAIKYQDEKIIKDNLEKHKSIKTAMERLDSKNVVASDGDIIKASSGDDIGVTNEEKPPYVFPPVDLLNKGDASDGFDSLESIKDTAQLLKKTLDTFGVKVTVTDYCQGPAVTRYELQPEIGTKVSKIVNLADDIKLNLAAADIRIEAPIPGKAAVGIEVPNKKSMAVYFRDLIESKEFTKSKSKVSFAVGKDIGGNVVVADIAKMPHLLVAGSTGSGKSVLINSLIMSIIFKAKPDEVKMIMIDPKQVELSVYNGIPHLLIPVVTDPKKAAGALNWAVMEMTNRYNLFKTYGVRNIEGFNEKVKAYDGDEEIPELKFMPQMVIIVDELADLMMTAKGEVEDAIVRITQLARAAGIHLVIATQRPSVDVITGLIKANTPSRIAMTCSSSVDSRTIIDMNGAEKLLGKGDMLYYPTGYPKPVRVQGAYLSDEEIADIVDFIKEQSGESKYDDNISSHIDNAAVSGGGASASAANDVDEFFVDAGRLVIEKNKGSASMLQRVFRIGSNRAARIIDQLCDAGVVGQEEGTKPRKVLMVMEEFENYVENQL